MGREIHELTKLQVNFVKSSPLYFTGCGWLPPVFEILQIWPSVSDAVVFALNEWTFCGVVERIGGIVQPTSLSVIAIQCCIRFVNIIMVNKKKNNDCCDKHGVKAEQRRMTGI